MNRSIYTMALLTGTLLAGCQTPAQKADAAVTIDSTQNANAAKQELNAEYPAFRKDADQQITDNDKKIARLREELSRPGKHPLDNARKQKIDNLEKKNADLRSTLYAYETQPSDWEAFKLKINHDKDDIRDAFKDFGDDLKK